jgi:hypothetical protein
MSTIAGIFRPIPFPTMDRLRNDPVNQVFTLLRIGFVALPILMGLDKFVEVMNDNWPMYLASEFNDIIPGSAQDAMYIVGAVEILAGLIVLVTPRFGGLLVAGWLAGIIASLLLVGGYGDIALRDFGLLLAALALFRLAGVYSGDSSDRGTTVSHGTGTVDSPSNGTAGASARGTAGSPGHARVG